MFLILPRILSCPSGSEKGTPALDKAKVVWGKFLVPDSRSRSKTQAVLLSLPCSLAGSGGTGKDQEGGQPAKPVVAAGDGEASRDARSRGGRGEVFVAEQLPLHGSIGPVGSAASHVREGFRQVFKRREREKRTGREQDVEMALKRSR